MVRPDYASVKVAELAALPRFPQDQDARLLVYRTLMEMVQYAAREPGDTWQDTVEKDETALDWLIKRVVNLWNKWEGIRELRAVYCSHYRPGDGIESTSAIYTDGVPPDPLLPHLALPTPESLEEWPKEELEAIGKAWAARNRLTPAQQRREVMRVWVGTHDSITVLDSDYDDALIGVAVLVSDRKTRYAVYDWEALVECLEDRENLTPDQAVQATGNLLSEVLLFYRPPDALRPAILTTPITQAEIDQALTVARVRREGWTPERLAEVEAEVRRREKQADEHD
jgi:hypothetical protein